MQSLRAPTPHSTSPPHHSTSPPINPLPACTRRYVGETAETERGARVRLQLRHFISYFFGFTVSHTFSRSTPPHTGRVTYLACAYAYSILIGAWNVMVCPIHGGGAPTIISMHDHDSGLGRATFVYALFSRRAHRRHVYDGEGLPQPECS